MAFDADAYAHALEPWELKVHGRTYVARPISVPAVLTFYEQAKAGALNNGHSQDAIAKLLRSVFPWRLHYLWADPVKLVLGMDADVQAALLEDFFGYLGRWSERRREMRGMISRPRTPPQNPATDKASPSV